MTYADQVKAGKSLLKQWYSQYDIQPLTAFSPGRTDTTVLIYHFGKPEVIDSYFLPIKCSLLETWRHCGIMKTTIVTNAVTEILEQFAADYSPYIKVYISNTLVSGDICSMSIDCNANLYKYFDTDYVLIVQNDGFPLQMGLDHFIGKYDYIGAPFVRHNLLTQISGLARNHAVGNGGFSLRSKLICEQASYYWEKKYSRHLSPRSRFTKEDAFYCCVLPLLERSYRQTVKFADLNEALSFSFDALYDREPAKIPFGFHGSTTFFWLKQKYGNLFPWLFPKTGTI